MVRKYILVLQRLYSTKFKVYGVEFFTIRDAIKEAWTP
jgi:hypothetical protein